MASQRGPVGAGFSLPVPLFETRILRWQSHDQFRGTPIMPKPLVIVTDAIGNVTQAQGISIKHRPAEMPWETVAAGPHYVNVGGASRDAFIENHGSDVDQRKNAALHDFVIADLASPDTSFRSELFDQRDHFGIRQRLATSTLVTVETAPRLLAQPAEFSEPVGDDEVRIWAAFTLIELEAHLCPDIVSTEIAYALRSHGEPELLQCRVNLQGRRAFEKELFGFAKVAVEHHAI